jgi:hypothetical protein
MKNQLYFEKEFRMKKILWTIVCILLVAAALSGCGNKEFPTGTYTRLGSEVEYRDDGTYTFWNDGEVVAEGTYTVQGDEIQVTDDYCAEEYANPGTYKWQHKDGKLTHELIEDLCEGRRTAVLQTWFGPK